MQPAILQWALLRECEQREFNFDVYKKMWLSYISLYNCAMARETTVVLDR